MDPARQVSYQKMVIASDLRNVRKVELMAEKIARSLHFSSDDRDSLAIAVTEIVGNAIVHGNKQDRSKNVIIEFEYQDDEIAITVHDEGEGFNEKKIAHPLEPENLLKESGRGIFIVRALMDQVEFFSSPQGTRVRMVKRKKVSGRSSNNPNAHN